MRIFQFSIALLRLFTNPIFLNRYLLSLKKIKLKQEMIKKILKI